MNKPLDHDLKLFLSAGLLFLLSFSFMPDSKRAGYILTEGIIYPKEKVAKECLYEGGILQLYYHIEQNFSVYPQARQFCKGTVKVLFEMEFDSSGLMTSFHPFERYNWYNVDNRARPMVTDLVEVISGAEGWKKNYQGNCFLPLAFTVMRTGRVNLDYVIYSKKTERAVRIGDK